MTTYITRLDPGPGDGPLVAVKDFIDVAGVPTTGACAAFAATARPAERDAVAVASMRAHGARFTGKTNAHELGLGATGVNPWYGTPTNPLGTDLVPGGSSSGNAVALANGECEVALGTDLGGSVRIPSACCGTTGLKTTQGRISLEGVLVGSPTLDTLGPMARDVAGLELGMRLLEPGFAVADWMPRRVGRVRHPADDAVDAAVDAALAAAGWSVVEVTIDHWPAALEAGYTIFLAEVWQALHALLDSGTGLSKASRATIAAGQHVTPDQLAQAFAKQDAFRAGVSALFTDVDLLAWPTMPGFPPARPSRREEDVLLSSLTMTVNTAGVPAVVLPVPAGVLPASLQLIGPHGAEERLLAAAYAVESAVA